MKTVLSFFFMTLFTTNAFSQSSAELTCRAQAKEAALQTYSSCITEARTTQVEQIRKSYQKELADLKAKYDKELKSLAGNKLDAKSEKNTAALPPKNSAKKFSAKPVKGIAKELPGRAAVEASEALPVQTVNENTPVVATAPESDSKLENEAEAAETVETIEMPVQ